MTSTAPLTWRQALDIDWREARALEVAPAFSTTNAPEPEVRPGYEKFQFANGVFMVHTRWKCVLDWCCLHRPSEHGTRALPMLFRGATVDRLCTHGVEHPDPDAHAYLEFVGSEGYDTHGCDGCCGREWTREDLVRESRDEERKVRYREGS